MAGQRNAGCGLLIIGFILGWGFAVVTRPADSPSVSYNPLPPPAVTYSAPAPPPPAVDLEAPADATEVTPSPSISEIFADSVEATEELALEGTLEEATEQSAEQLASNEPLQRAGPTDSQIRQMLVERSIASYSGACPCPYNVMRNGRRCGGNSAYSRPGGASPICYPEDVTDAAVQRFRAAN